MTKKLAILKGDGIGPEIVREAVRVLDKLIEQGLDVSYEYAPLGGEAYDQFGSPYPSAAKTPSPPAWPTMPRYTTPPSPTCANICRTKYRLST